MQSVLFMHTYADYICTCNRFSNANNMRVLEFLKFVETLPLMHHFTRKGWFLWNALVHVCYFRPVTRILDAENLHRRAVLSIIFFRLHKKRSHIRIISAYIHIIKAGYTHMRLHYLHMQKESGNSIYPLSFSEFNH